MSNSTDAEVVVNIEAELAYWQLTYRISAFHRTDFDFSQYVASLKFAYDTYLRLHDRPLELVLPELRGKYRQTIPTNQQLDWERAVHLIRAVWERLRLSGARNQVARDGGPIRRPVNHLRRPRPAYG